MNKNSVIKAFKDGIKGELDSIRLYEDAAGRSQGEVKTFFLERAEEEKRHYNFLLSYYRLYDEGGDQPLDTEDYESFSPVISEDFIKRVASDKYIFSAISTALLLELRAIEYYRRCSEEIEDKKIRDFFTFMTSWEKDHYESLMKISEESEKIFWEINRFEPF